MATEKPLEAIEITEKGKGLTVGSRALKVGDVVQVSEIGEGTARQLIEAKRAKAVVQKAEG
jgi:hypothetical protein